MPIDKGEATGFIKETIREIDAAGRVKLAELRADLPLSKQGMDSLDMFTLYLAVEQKFGVKIPDDEVDRLQSLDALVAYLADHS